MFDRLSRLSAKEKGKILLKVRQTALEDEKAATGCARSVLHALHKHLGIGHEDFIKAAAPFAGGGARSGNLCGALAGGMMGIGLVYAPNAIRNSTAMPGYIKCMELAGVLCDRFKGKFGAFNCREIQSLMWGRSWNLRDSREREDFLRPEFHDKCGEVAGEAAILAAEIILENAVCD